MYTGAGIRLYVELHTDNQELWLKLEDDNRRLIGYARFVRVTELRAGLTTYRAEEFRSPDNPPPSQSLCRSVFEEISPGDYELLVSGKSVLREG